MPQKDEGGDAVKVEELQAAATQTRTDYQTFKIWMNIKFPSLKNLFFFCFSRLKYQNLTEPTCFCVKFVTRKMFIVDQGQLFLHILLNNRLCM